MNANGTSQHQVWSASASGGSPENPVWSPDSSKLYFDNGSDIFVGSASGTGSLTQLTDDYEYGGPNTSPSVSPDGTTIAYQANEQLHSVNSTTADQAGTTLTSGVAQSTMPSYVQTSSPSTPTPSWWSGTTCDTAHNSGSAPLSNAGVTTSFYGVIACGGGSAVITTFGGESVSEQEWQCTELVLRYMDLRWGVPNYVADGYQIVSNYTGSIMTKVTNTGSNLPVVGDVISFNRVYPYNTTAGHTAIVTAVSGSALTIMQQNDGSTGIGTVPVSGGGVSTTTVNGWLHHN
jgi:hypothetical protein